MDAAPLMPRPWARRLHNPVRLVPPLLQVQHAGLQESCAADTLTVDFLVRAVRWAFPDFNYLWLVDEIRENAPKASYFSLGISSPAQALVGRWFLLWLSTEASRLGALCELLAAAEGPAKERTLDHPQ